ncbi:MAG: helix-turn-helix domain-containing protein [Bacteroidales bacterium]|nr:helix-turn-helix domain-containing protein [Bacteroidales bacterium]
MAFKYRTFEELKDRNLGKVGTPERDAYEAEVRDAIQAYKIGEAIKNTRLSQHLTQEQLGKRIGVQRAQISRLEKGRSISFSSLTRVFKALGVSEATLDLGKVGKVALW